MPRERCRARGDEAVRARRCTIVPAEGTLHPAGRAVQRARAPRQLTVRPVDYPAGDVSVLVQVVARTDPVVAVGHR